MVLTSSAAGLGKKDCISNKLTGCNNFCWSTPRPISGPRRASQLRYEVVASRGPSAWQPAPTLPVALLPRFLVLACAALGATALSACTNDDPPVAANVELERFQGLWYEIARMPRDYDETCHDTIAEYRLVAPTELEMTHTCHLDSPSGSLSRFRAPAKASDPKVPAKLTLDLGLYHGDYWILDVGKGYDYALVGHPSLTMLWILSRTPSLDQKTLASLESEASRLGFAASALRMTPQSQAGAP